MSKRDRPYYDPFASRNVENAMTNTEALISVMKCALGTGCLAMPLAFYNSGYVNGIIGTLTLGSILVYAIHILMNATYVLCKRNQVPSLTYRESMEIALLNGPPYFSRFNQLAGSLVDIFQALYHFGICCVYILFIGDTIKQLIQSIANTSVEIPLKLYLILMILPLIFIFSIQDFLLLVPYSFAATVMLVLGKYFGIPQVNGGRGYLDLQNLSIGLGIIFVYLCYDLPSLSEREAFQNIKQLPLLYGTVIFALESIGVLFAIEANMESPKDFLGIFGILNQGMFGVLLIYVIVGFYGYWHYGDEIRGNIILNLPNVFINQIVQIMYAIGVYFSYALQGYITVDVVWRQFMSKNICDNWQIPLEKVVRIIIVLSSVLVCVAFPEFDIFLPLVGSSCISFLGLIFPAVIDICTMYQDGYGTQSNHLIFDIFLIVLGTVGGVSGTFIGIIGIYNRITSPT